MNNKALVNASHLKSAAAIIKNADGIPFQNILSVSDVKKEIEKIDYRPRYDLYPPEITLWLLLSQALGNETQDKAVSRLVAHYAVINHTIPSSNTSAYSQARSKLPENLVSNLARNTAMQMEESGEMNKFTFLGHPIKFMDGTTVSMPDTAKNQMHYPQPDTQKDGVGFPLSRLVTITSFSSGMVLDLAIGSYSGKGTGEHALLRQLLHNFHKDDLVIADAYYASFFLIAHLTMHGMHFIFPKLISRLHDFRAGIRLGEKDHIITWKKPRKPEWMDQETYDSFPNNITLRECEIIKSVKGYRTQKMIIVTNFLNAKIASKETISNLYSLRWMIELDIRIIKQTLNMDILKGKTPEMVRKEIWSCILAYNLIRKIMAQSAILYGKNPRDLSFIHALNLVTSFLEKMIFSEKKSVYIILLKKISEIEVNKRPNRYEPRVVKRRPRSSFPFMQKSRRKYKEVA